MLVLCIPEFVHSVHEKSKIELKNACFSCYFSKQNLSFGCKIGFSVFNLISLDLYFFLDVANLHKTSGLQNKNSFDVMNSIFELLCMH
jgi:hypothetical protein